MYLYIFQFVTLASVKPFFFQIKLVKTHYNVYELICLLFFFHLKLFVIVNESVQMVDLRQ